MATFLRVLAGTAVYALIVVLAAPFPSAAGMMLVFPTLNGIAYVLSDRSRVLAMTPSMLWMPIINGTLCAGYLLAFLALARSLASVALAWALTGIAIAIFVLLVWRPRVQRGIAPGHQLRFAVAATIVGIVFAVVATRLWDGAPAGSGHALSWTFAGDVLAHNAGKIAVFALCLAAFLATTRLLPIADSWRGILAGLPFAPFAGLVSIAADTAIDLPARLEIVRHMAASVWVGPAIAIWFIYAFPRALVRLGEGSGRAVLALGAAWGLCAFAVAAATIALRLVVTG